MQAAPKIPLALGCPQYPVLDAFMACRAPVSVIRGPLGAGKTFAAAQRILVHMKEQRANAEGIRPSRWIAVRNTYPTLMSTTAKDFEAVFRGLGKMRYGGLEPPTFHVRAMLEDGTKIVGEMIFLALDREDSVKKLQGMQLTGAWMNEMKELVKPVVDMTDGRLGRYPTYADGGLEPTWFGMLGDTNSPDEDHWLYRLAEEDRPKGWEFFVQPGGVFPTGTTNHLGREIFRLNANAENLSNLPQSYYERLMEGKDDAWIKVFLANEYGFVVEGKPVHPEYIDSSHTSKVELDVDPRYPLTLGLDYGREPACAIAQHIEHVGRWHIIDEFVSMDMSASIFGPELKRYLDRNYSGMDVDAWGDPAGDAQGQATEDTPMLIMRAAGIPVRAAPSNVPALRRAAIANPCLRMCMDSKPALQVSPKAKQIRKGLMGGWVYRRLQIAGHERYTDLPEKGPLSHPCEAAEYALLGGGEGRAAIRPARHERNRLRQTRANM